MSRTGRPDVVVFIPDQLRADALGCFGNPVASTPNLDALAARGTRFAQAFGQHPFCSQTTNLAADAAHRETVDGLRTRLLSWLVETADVIGPSDPRFDTEGAVRPRSR